MQRKVESKNLFSEKKICIMGAGGFAREVYCCLMDIYQNEHKSIEGRVVFCVPQAEWTEETIMGCPQVAEDTIQEDDYVFFIATGEPQVRKKIFNKFPSAVYATIIHPSAIVSPWAEIGEGSIITAGCVLTCNIKVGKQAHLNLQTTVGHDCVIGNFFTTAPGVNVSGNCHFEDCVYLGTNSCVKQGVNICDNVTIGMGGVVVKNIQEHGIYIGSPVQKIR